MTTYGPGRQKSPPAPEAVTPQQARNIAGNLMPRRMCARRSGCTCPICRAVNALRSLADQVEKYEAVMATLAKLMEMDKSAHEESDNG